MRLLDKGAEGSDYTTPCLGLAEDLLGNCENSRIITCRVDAGLYSIVRGEIEGATPRYLQIPSLDKGRQIRNKGLSGYQHPPVRVTLCAAITTILVVHLYRGGFETFFNK